MNNAWLAHHGILGQKWGVRRFQNEDGTLTSAGKKRLNRNLRAANKLDRDAEDLRKHGYNEEADAVQKVANDQRAKGEKKEEFWTDDRKKMAKNIAIGSAFIAGTALAVYGARKLDDAAIKGMQEAYASASRRMNIDWAFSMGTASTWRKHMKGGKLSDAAVDGFADDMEANARRSQALSKAFKGKSEQRKFNSNDKIDYLKKVATETLRPDGPNDTWRMAPKLEAESYMAQKIIDRNKKKK